MMSNAAAQVLQYCCSRNHAHPELQPQPHSQPHHRSMRQFQTPDQMCTPDHFAEGVCGDRRLYVHATCRSGHHLKRKALENLGLWCVPAWPRRRINGGTTCLLAWVLSPVRIRLTHPRLSPTPSTMSRFLQNGQADGAGSSSSSSSSTDTLRMMLAPDSLLPCGGPTWSRNYTLMSPHLYCSAAVALAAAPTSSTSSGRPMERGAAVGDDEERQHQQIRRETEYSRSG